MPKAPLGIAAAAIFFIALAGCVTNPANYKPNSTEQALTGSLFRGEWYPGYLYEIAFRGVGVEMSARIRVIDSDASRTEYKMNARVEVDGADVTVKFNSIDRVDRLTFNPERSKLSGYSVYRGRHINRSLWAAKVE